jgi:hypothetical protein
MAAHIHLRLPGALANPDAASGAAGATVKVCGVCIFFLSVQSRVPKLQLPGCKWMRFAVKVGKNVFMVFSRTIP